MIKKPTSTVAWLLSLGAVLDLWAFSPKTAREPPIPNVYPDFAFNSLWKG